MAIAIAVDARTTCTLPGSDIRGNGNGHPTDKGYADVADLWYGLIKSYLPSRG